MSTNWQINTQNAGAQMPGVASLLQNQSAPPLVSDAQYRGEPIAPADPNATPYDLAGIAPPPAVAAPAPKTETPSWTDYLAQQQAAFIPQTNAGWNPFNNQGQEQFTRFDKNAALKNFVEQGGQINYQDFLNSLPKDPGYGDVFSRALQGLGGSASAAQQWLSAYSPEFQKIGEFDPKNNPGGYLVSEIGNQPTLTRRRNDIGDNWVEYRSINSDGTLGKPKVEYQPESGGFGGFLKTIAPIALGVLAPGVGSAIGGALSSAGITGLANTLATGAILGGGTSALTGGDVLKGAALGGLGAGVSSGIGSLTSGLDPAIVKAAQGAGSALARGAVTGDIDPTAVFAGGATGYLSDTVRSQLEDLLPTKNLYEQNIAPGIKPEVSVAGMIENIGRNAAINAPGTLIRGGDLGNMLANTAIGEAAKTATGYVPKTGDDFIDRLTSGATSALVSSGLRDVVAGDDKSSTTPRTVASADKGTASETQTGSQEQALSELMAMLGGGSSAFIPTNDYDIGRAFSAARATRDAAARNRQMEAQIATLLGRRLSEV